MDLLSVLPENNLWLTGLMQSQIAQMTLAFIIAARLHRRWVRKDMAEQFAVISKSIDNVADKVSTGLALHSIRIDELTSRVDTIERKIRE